MSDGDGALGEIRRALGAITQRLDALAVAVAAIAPATVEPAGVMLDEPVHAALGPVDELLRLGRAATFDEAILLALDRILSRARADAAALLVPLAGAPFRVLGARGLPLLGEVRSGEGIVGRATDTGEIIQGGPGLGAPDPLLTAHGLARAVAVPVLGPDGVVAAVLLAGRRRPVSFDAEALGALLVTGDRVREWLGRMTIAPGEPPPSPAPADASGAPAPLLEADVEPGRGPSDTGRSTSQTSLAELANLLAVVVGRLAAVRDRVTDRDAAGDLGVAEDAAWRAAEAVRRVLGFAPGAHDAHAAPLDLAALVRETVLVAEQRWAGEGREARVTLDLEPVPTVLGNAEELRHALDHLLQNAREASETGAPVTLRLHWDGGSRVELAVVDEGRGMDAATAVRAVEPFFTTKGPGRLGVGLAITRATATRHRGELQIDSRPGRGTTVKVQLPVAPGAARAAGGGAAGRPAGARVLVVEDEPDVREVLVQGLAQDGATVRIADDVRAALALLESTPIDAAVIDLMLPGGSGLEVSRQTRRLHPGASIILMTGWPGRVDPHTLEAHGVDAVVEKPVGLDALRAILAGLLARSGPRPD